MVFAALRGVDENSKTTVQNELVLLARTRVGPIVSLYPNNVVFVDRLPKTRSGKILRKMIRMMIDSVFDSLAQGVPVYEDRCPISTPATIEDVAVKMEMWQTIINLAHTSA
ncbi:hypothetical protein LPJ57_003115 [Coemansia sp. RSA 486]|nr:hypothetical protein LPJ57_003115 [Coemansia sp. RSA 486]